MKTKNLLLIVAALTLGWLSTARAESDARLLHDFANGAAESFRLEIERVWLG